MKLRNVYIDKVDGTAYYFSDRADCLSELAMKTFELYPELDIVAVFTGDSISLRSNNKGSNVNVAEIAKKHGGGGHHNAAGYKVDSTVIWKMFFSN